MTLFPLRDLSPRVGALKYIVIILFCIVALVNCTNNTPATITDTLIEEARVIRVIDGDTIEIEGGVRVRYVGIDAPETYPQAEYYGPEATAKNRELVEGLSVRLERDISDKDKYGRLLRYVWVGDVFVNAELVKLGYAEAHAYPPDVKYQELFSRLEEEAVNAGLGIWKR